MSKMHHNTGWAAVERDVEIEFDIEKTPLQIWTDSVLMNTGDQITVMFYDDLGQAAGGLWFYFWDTPGYWLDKCSSNTLILQKDLPSEVEKVWKMTVTKTSDVRVVLTCNDEEVFNFVLSILTCGESLWRDYWSRDVTKIRFTKEDTASDFYLEEFAPGNKN